MHINLWSQFWLSWAKRVGIIRRRSTTSCSVSHPSNDSKTIVVFLTPFGCSKGQSNSDGISDWNRSPSIWSVLCHLIFRAVLHPRHGVDVEINQYLSVKYCRMSKTIINRLSLQGKIGFALSVESWQHSSRRLHIQP